jgi:hypothetical protein
MTFFVAGAGVIGIVVVMAPLLKGNWVESGEVSKPSSLDGHHDVVVELIPGNKPGNKAKEIR